MLENLVRKNVSDHAIEAHDAEGLVFQRWGCLRYFCKRLRQCKTAEERKIT